MAVGFHSADSYNDVIKNGERETGGKNCISETRTAHLISLPPPCRNMLPDGSQHYHP